VDPCDEQEGKQNARWAILSAVAATPEEPVELVLKAKELL
jgi:hypothetical protein